LSPCVLLPLFLLRPHFLLHFVRARLYPWPLLGSRP
jgi:hypothetical protein